MASFDDRFCPTGISCIELARVFEDPLRPGEWRVEFIDDSQTRFAIFSGPNARALAFRYAAMQEGYSSAPLGRESPTENRD